MIFIDISFTCLLHKCYATLLHELCNELYTLNFMLPAKRTTINRMSKEDMTGKYETATGHLV